MHSEPPPTANTPAEAVSVFMQHVPRLFGIAYRVLGSAGDTEDVLQAVWLRWQKTDRSAVVSPVAFLSSTTTRLAVEVAQSPRAHRETYMGPWLPEPIDTSAEPAVGGHHAKALDLAELLFLQELCPIKRAAYVLREAFDCDYSEIAEILQLGVVDARKIVSRTRKRLAEQREMSWHGETPTPRGRRRRSGSNGGSGLTVSLADPRRPQSVLQQPHDGRCSTTCPGPCARKQSGDRDPR
ncbi:sigma factor [Streptomyces sp. NPDC001970]